MSKQFCWLVALFVWQLLLTLVIYYDAAEIVCHEFWPNFRTHDIPIGLGDFQIALAMLLLIAVDIRWTLRVPLSLVLFLSAFGAHGFAWARYFYPFVGGNEYLMAVWVAVATAITLWIWKWRRRVSLKQSSELPVKPCTVFQFQFADLIVCIAAVSVVFMMARQAFVLTRVSESTDASELFRFFQLHFRIRYAGGLPITLAAIASQALAWTAVFVLGLSSKFKHWQLIVGVPVLLLLLTFAEFGISYCSELIYDKPPPDVPVSHAPLFVWLMRWDFESVVRIALVFLSRLVACSVSLFCLRMAGFQWQPVSHPADKDHADAR